MKTPTTSLTFLALICLAAVGCKPDPNLKLGSIPSYGFATTGAFATIDLPVPASGKTGAVYIQGGKIINEASEVQKNIPFCSVSDYAIPLSKLLLSAGAKSVRLPRPASFLKQGGPDYPASINFKLVDRKLQLKIDFTGVVSFADASIGTQDVSIHFTGNLSCSRGSDTEPSDDTLIMTVGELMKILKFTFESVAPAV